MSLANRQITPIRKIFPAGSWKGTKAFNAEALEAGAFDELPNLGIKFEDHHLEQMLASYNSAEARIARSNKSNFLKKPHAMDAIQPTVTSPSISTPIQFLQFWTPGFVYVMTAARNIDRFAPMNIAGSWEDEQIVVGILERTGYAVPYGDYTNVPYASWNTNFNTQTIVRFEQGMAVNRLEELRAARERVDSASAKRESCGLALEIERNRIGFFGYNSGNNQTYGLLNAPGQPAYVTVANGASASPLWSTKTFLEITKDIRSAVVSLRTNSQDLIDPANVDLTLGIATNSVDWITTTSDLGISVMDWIKQAYPRMNVISAPELNSANSGANVFYLYAENIVDQSTDDGMVYAQYVQSKFQTLGVQQTAKGYIEDYANATAGIICKRPWAVVRRSGI